MTLLSFLDDPSIKEKYIARVFAHQQADEIVKGKYWERGKGCAVGCTIHSSDHSYYEAELGIPEWLAHLEDVIFEALPNDRAKEWPRQFLEAIPVGVSLSRVKWQFCAFILSENIEHVLALEIDEKLKTQVVSAIRTILNLHEKAAQTGEWDKSAAESAAWSARSARSAAWSARSAAASAAAESAESARSAAESAAASAAYIRYADKLLELLRAA